VTWGNGRGRVIRAWIATLVPVIVLALAGLWYGLETYFQAKQNARDIERLQTQTTINRDLIWQRTGVPGMQGGE